MSISTIQYNSKKEEFTQELLKKGIEPNNYELNRMLSNWFDSHIMGMPCYAPIKQKPYEESSKDDYNHNFSTLEEDLVTAYKANIEANNKAVAMQEYYDLEKTNVQNAISKLALRVDNITEAMKRNSRVKQYVEVFDNLYGVEFYGDTARNIPYTTSFIDLYKKSVYTEKTNAQVNKISLSNATITLDGVLEYNGFKTKGDLNKILNDTKDELYVIACESKTNEEKTLTINIDIGFLATFNTVSFEFTSGHEMICELLLSDDGRNFLSVYDIANRNYAEWCFDPKQARYIRIVCHKSEPDGQEKSGEEIVFYEYDYIYKNVSIAIEEFESKSIFVSKPIEFRDLTNVIKLDATELIFAKTRIDYFIGFDNGKDKIGWDAIQNHKDHELFMFQKRHKILNYSIEEFDYMESDGLRRIYKLPDGVNRNSIKLTPGYNMWSVRRYVRREDELEDDGFDLMSGDFSNLINKCEMTQDFMDCENYSNFSVYPNVLYIFTQYVDMKHPDNLFDSDIKILSNDYLQDYYESQEYLESNEEETKIIRVFINGYETLPVGRSKYSFNLRKGINKIQIAVYFRSMSLTTLTSGSLNQYPSLNDSTTWIFYHTLNFKKLTNDVFAMLPMKYTNPVVLSRMLKESYEYYTIKNNYIYVNCEPFPLIRTKQQDMGYFLTYYCLRDDLKNYFTNNKLTFRIMAILHSEDKNLSPQLLNFRISGR